MKKSYKIKEIFDIKNIVKTLLAFSFSCFYVAYMKYGADICEIDEKYAVYLCVAILTYQICKYLYKSTLNYLLSKEKKDGEKV